MPEHATLAPAAHHRVIEVMGTVFTVDVRDTSVDPRVIDTIVDWWHWVDQTFSTYRPDSAISRLATGRARVDECPTEVATVLDLCAAASRLTGGYFTACPGGRLDPSGMVKGWSVELASQLLEAAGSRAHALNGGGDVRVVGAPSADTPWAIGVADPRTRQLLTVVSGSNLAVATSGSAERGAHIVDPFTGRAVTDPVSVTVTGPDLTWADTFATAAVAMGAGARDWLERRSGYEAVGVDADGAIWHTSGWPG